MDKLKAIESFVTVARVGNFALAAKQLGVSRALIGKRILQLEAGLKVRLFHRTTRKTSLTDEGRQYLDLWGKILLDVEEQERSFLRAGAEPRGLLRVVSARSFGSLHIAPVVAQFTKRFPHLRVELELTSTPRTAIELIERGYDISIRIVPPPPGSRAIARKLAKYEWVLCASPDYIRQYGTPAAPKDLQAHRCLTTPQLNPQLRSSADWVFNRAGRRVSEKIAPAASVNSVIALRTMTLDGSGIARLPSYCIRQDLAARALVPVMEGYSLDSGTIYAVYYREKPASEKIRLFVNLLKEKLRGTL